VDNLLKPDIGLMFWTVLTFLLMVFILKKMAWGPILQALDDREAKIKGDLDSARANREEVERLKADYERQLTAIEARARALLADAESQGQKARDRILKEAETESRNLAERTRQQLEIEKDRLVGELRREVSDLSIQVTEKLLQQNLDRKVQEKFVQDFLTTLDKSPKN
jgi:F-type H+-transporting ATPase subunit b